MFFCSIQWTLNISYECWRYIITLQVIGASRRTRWADVKASAVRVNEILIACFLIENLSVIFCKAVAVKGKWKSTMHACRASSAVGGGILTVCDAWRSTCSCVTLVTRGGQRCPRWATLSHAAQSHQTVASVCQWPPHQSTHTDIYIYIYCGNLKAVIWGTQLIIH